MARLAGPVATAELGWMAMGLVDTMMVGRVSAEAIGAVSIGSHLFFAIAIFGMGMLLGLDYLVAHAFGAGRIADARRALVQGVYLSAMLSVVLTAVVLIVLPRLESLGIRPEIARQAVPYLRALLWSLLPLLLYATLRRYLQALGMVRVVMVALVSANVINALVNWVLVFGHLGFPAMGAEGSGWATSMSRVYMFVFLLISVIRHERRAEGGMSLPWRFDAKRLFELMRLGLPSALQTGLEVGVFTAATILAGSLSAVQLAAHQVALGAAAFSFMVPLGISSAAAVRVGQAMGRIDAIGAARAGWTALLLGGGFMSGAAVAFIVAPSWIIRIFTNDAAVLQTGVALLGVAAVFQLFDGLQVVATGVLRGTGDTRTAMLANLAGHWLLGLPVGYALCFWYGAGVVGLWIGLCTGLVIVSIVLIAVWSMRTREMLADNRQRDAA
jgi:MATE family multidrug resistance protein